MERYPQTSTHNFDQIINENFAIENKKSVIKRVRSRSGLSSDFSKDSFGKDMMVRQPTNFFHCSLVKNKVLRTLEFG